MKRKYFGSNFCKRGCISNHNCLQPKPTEKDQADGKSLKRGRSGWHKAVTAGVRAPAMGGQEN